MRIGKQKQRGDSMTIEEKERLRPHFEQEDVSFLIRCMTNRNKDCNGCKYISLCEEILLPKDNEHMKQIKM